MANSMNNWLAFSLSPQEHHHQDHSQNSVSALGGFNSNIETDVSGDCFGLSSDSTAAPFGILEAFHTNNHHQSHDWNMIKGLGMSSDMLAGGSCGGESQEPKLENFLGGNHEHGLNKVPGDGNSSNSNSSSIGLSMIKTWLRNQPSPAHQAAPPANGTSAQTLSLSMSSSSETNKQQQQKGTATVAAVESQACGGEAVPRKTVDTFGQRTSIYRGVTRHRWTGRYEAHLWDNSCRREGQTRKGRQVYLGGYDKEEKAARAYDLAALKYWGTTTTTNFPISTYEKELEEMKHMTRQEYVASLRRKSSGFSRGASIYRGVTRHHQHGRWQARIGRVAGNKDLYLGTFSTQEEAAEAYDIAAIKFRGLNAVTNFDMNRYDVKSILESTTLPIGGAAKRLKDAADQAEMAASLDGASQRTTSDADSMTSDGINNYCAAAAGGWPTIAFQQPPPQPFSLNYSPPYSGHRPVGWCKQEQDSFQDFHQLQLGSTHNFFQHPSVLHNLMNMESSSSAGADHQFGGGDGGYAIPMGAVTVSDHNGSFGDGEVKPLGYDTSDPYLARNLYYLSQQSNGGGGSACNNWVPTAVPTLAPRTNSMAVCHGAQVFSVWNDT